MADWIITTAVGTGEKGFAGDGGPASAALLNGPFDIAFDRAGNLYFSDTFNHRIRRVDAATGDHHDDRRQRRAGLFRRRRPGDRGRAQRALWRRRRPRRQCLYRRPAQPPGAPHRRRVRDHHDAGRHRRGGLFRRWRAGGAGGPRRAERARLRSRASGTSISPMSPTTGCGSSISRAATIATFAGTGTAEHGGDGGPAREAAHLRRPRGQGRRRRHGLYPRTPGQQPARGRSRDRHHHNDRRHRPGAAMAATAARRLPPCSTRRRRWRSTATAAC